MHAWGKIYHITYNYEWNSSDRAKGVALIQSSSYFLCMQTMQSQSGHLRPIVAKTPCIKICICKQIFFVLKRTKLNLLTKGSYVDYELSLTLQTIRLYTTNSGVFISDLFYRLHYNDHESNTKLSQI